MLTVNVMSENRKADTTVAVSQFKRGGLGCWINSIGTAPKAATKAVFGVKSTFLSENTNFRGIGFAFSMLRSIQLLQ
jgi:hypothetical protein